MMHKITSKLIAQMRSDKGPRRTLGEDPIESIGGVPVKNSSKDKSMNELSLITQEYES